MSSSVTAAEILDVFTEAVVGRGGRIADTFHSGQRLFSRAVLPDVKEVRTGDGMQGGVALKATAAGVWLYPYLFRLVCQNGAIIAETVASRSLGDLYDQEPEFARYSIREGVEACCEPEVFLDSVRKMRAARDTQADLALNLMPFFSRLSTSATAGLLPQIMDQLFREGDHSHFGLANAVTAVARETQDPDLRWDLEEFGGSLAVGGVPRRPTDWGWEAVSRSREAVGVG